MRSRSRELQRNRVRKRRSRERVRQRRKREREKERERGRILTPVLEGIMGAEGISTISESWRSVLSDNFSGSLGGWGEGLDCIEA